MADTGTLEGRLEKSEDAARRLELDVFENDDKIASRSWERRIRRDLA